MRIRALLYRIYEFRLAHDLDPARVPRHIGVILDGNRRWAKSVGAPAAHGHRRGANKVTELLHWCEEAGVEVVTLWLLSTDNLARPRAELDKLVEIICTLVEKLASNGNWQIKLVGRVDLLGAAATRLRAAEVVARGRHGLQVNVAIGYGGREEIVDAVKAELRDAQARGEDLASLAQHFTADNIGAHLYTAGLPDPDLVIRTSGEQRLSGFMIWQTVHSEYYFCETYWPDFRRTDFLRALRDYERRERRMGR